MPSTPPRPGWRRVLVAVLAAAALCAVFDARVASSFRSYRLKVITRPAAPVGGAVAAEVPAFPGEGLGPPFAVIARVRHLSAAPLEFSIAVDGNTICRATVRRGEHRLDCAVTAWDAGRSHTLRVQAAGQAGPVWSLAYLEVATHHGATRSYDLVIAPSQFTPSQGWSWPWAAAVFLVCGSLPFVRGPRLNTRLARWHAAALVLVVAFLSLVWLSRYFTPYLLLLSPRLFVTLAVLAYLPQLSAGIQGLLCGDGHVARRRAALLFVVGALVLGVYGVVVERLRSDQFHGNYSGFLRISEAMYDRDPILNERQDVRDSLVLTPDGGYDGQFVYFTTFDPLLTRYRSDPATYRLFIDAPPYRFGRIGFSWLAALFSGGRWQFFPGVMMWLLLWSLAAAGVGLAAVGTGADAKLLLGGLVVLIPGFWQSVQLCLPEPVAASLLVGGFLLARRGRPVLAGALFAGSLLIRETGAVLVVAIAGEALWRRQRKDAIWLTAVAVLPYVVWRLYVGWVLFPDWGTQGFWMNVDNIGAPLGGLVQLLGHVRHGDYYPAAPALSRAAVYFSALLAGGFCIAVVAAVRARTAPAVAAAVYGLLALSLTYDIIWIHVGNGQRGTYELFLALALFTVTPNLSKPMKYALGLFWAAAAGYVFFGAYDATFIREAFLV